MDEVTKRRWYSAETRPKDFAPRVALDAAGSLLDEDPEIEHVFVVLAKTRPDGGTATRLMQAGTLPPFAQMGALWQALDSM